VNWLSWVLVGARRAVCLCIGWTARGYYYEREEGS
jgi:hypothetical protein